jgi:hypothetical protein
MLHFRPLLMVEELAELGGLPSFATRGEELGRAENVRALPRMSDPTFLAIPAPWKLLNPTVLGRMVPLYQRISFSAGGTV